MGFEHLEQLAPAVPTAAEPHWHILDGSERAATEETGMMGAGIFGGEGVFARREEDVRCCCWESRAGVWEMSCLCCDAVLVIWERKNENRKATTESRRFI